ncbi:MAG TPA: hypothetical protein V6D34_05295 [Candidatus Sericytochromatia bacterium]|jgi:hypothetical protein
MKRLLIRFVGLVALTTSGCALSSFLTITPKSVVEQTVSCPTNAKPKAERFQVLSTQRSAQGVIVLYSAFCPTSDGAQQVFGHKVVKRNGMTWQVSGSGSYGAENESAPSARLVEYGISHASTQHPTNTAAKNEEPYTLLYGRALKPQVVAVEATFNNGKTIRDVSRNGVFALFSAGATGICELRVLGADSQILRREDFVVRKPFSQYRRSTQCLPSQQL